MELFNKIIIKAKEYEKLLILIIILLITIICSIFANNNGKDGILNTDGNDSTIIEDGNNGDVNTDWNTWASKTQCDAYTYYYNTIGYNGGNNYQLVKSITKWRDSPYYIENELFGDNIRPSNEEIQNAIRKFNIDINHKTPPEKMCLFIKEITKNFDNKFNTLNGDLAKDVRNATYLIEQEVKGQVNYGTYDKFVTSLVNNYKKSLTSKK